jgi:hypothetical protein
MFLLKVGFCIVLEKVSPGNRLLADKGLNVFQGIAVLENNIVNIELTAGFQHPLHPCQSNPLPEVRQVMESKRRRDDRSGLVEMVR